MKTGTGSRLNSIWKGIVRRCHSPSCKEYRWYGARGITVDPAWRTFVGFLDWALDSGYYPDATIDRLDSRLGYSPANCRWISRELNATRRELSIRVSHSDAFVGGLTEATVAAATPREKAYKLADGLGLFLHVSRTGHRSWRLAYRFEGKHQLLTIGAYPAIPLSEAREHALIARSKLSKGRNPAAIKRESTKRQQRRRSV